MATFGSYLSIPGLIAATTMASNQYKIVRAATTAGQFALAATPATDNVIGVLQDDPAASQPGDIAFVGICKVLAETSINEGDRVTCSSTSRAKATTTDGDRVVGFALDASASAGDIIRIMLYQHDLYKA